MSGFFRRLIPDASRLNPIGYKIGLELMVRGRLRVREVPITFRDRDLGASKMNWRQQFNFLRHLGRLYAFRFAGLVRFVTFCLVGASGFVVDSAFYFGLQELGASHLFARFLSFWPAVSSNWLLNRAITFRDRPRAPRARQWSRFAVSSIIGFSANFGAYWTLTGFVAFFDRYRFLAFAVGVVIGSAVNFAAATRYVYRNWSVGGRVKTRRASRMTRRERAASAIVPEGRTPARVPEAAAGDPAAG